MTTTVKVVHQQFSNRIKKNICNNISYVQFIFIDESISKTVK